MLKALLKKQFLELNSFYFQDKKTGKRRSIGGIIGYIILFLFVFASIAVIFVGISSTLCTALVDNGFEWLYFSLLSLMAIALGVFGSVFNTYSSLYLSKDNDLLLSMPIPTSKIVISRMTGVYLMGMLYSSLVLVPMVLVYTLNYGVSLPKSIFQILLIFVVGLLVLTLTCVLGFFVALISKRLKNKSITTVIISLAFLTLYYVVYFKANEYLKTIIQNAEVISEKIVASGYLLYQLGLAATGEVSSMLLFCGITMLLLVATFFVMSKTLIKIATSSTSGKKAVYKEKAVKQQSIKATLLKRELKKFVSSSVCMMNCGLGIVIMLVAAVAAVIKADYLRDNLLAVFRAMNMADFVIPIAAASVCLISSMDEITAPSVSLEGKSLWIIRSLPVESRDILRAKQHLHLVLNELPTLILTCAIAWVIKADVVNTVLMCAQTAIFVKFCSAFGLMLNLKKPDLEWTNETVPVKQSMAVMISMFGGWLIAFVMGGSYYFTREYIGTEVHMIVWIAVIAAAAFGLDKWIYKKGTRIFESL